MRLIIFISCFLTGCASVNPQPFISPDNKQAYFMKCSGMGRTLHDCYVETNKLCPDGYNVMDQNSKIIATNGVVATKQTMSVECK